MHLSSNDLRCIENILICKKTLPEHIIRPGPRALEFFQIFSFTIMYSPLFKVITEKKFPDFLVVFTFFSDFLIIFKIFPLRTITFCDFSLTFGKNQFSLTRGNPVSDKGYHGYLIGYRYRRVNLIGLCLYLSHSVVQRLGRHFARLKKCTYKYTNNHSVQNE